MTRALDSLQSSLGTRLDETLFKFTDEFPPVAVYQRSQTVQEYLSNSTNGLSHKQISMEEMLLVNIANNNPAAQPYKELFDDSALSQTAYIHSISLLGNFFAKQPSMAGRGKGETLVEILIAPSKASPYSLEGQLQFLLEKWGDLLGEDIIRRILRAIDFVREEVMRQHGGGDSHPIIEAPTYGGAYAEYERYSLDKDWMPRTRFDRKEFLCLVGTAFKKI